MTIKEKSLENTHKLHENSLKKFFEMKNQYDKKNVSKIIINLMKIH